MTDHERGEFRFDWQKEPEGSFWKWFLPEVLAHTPDSPGAAARTVEDFAELTDQFTDVRLTLQVNGVAVPVKGFMEGVEQNLEYMAKKEAVAMYEAAGIPDLYGVLVSFQADLEEIVRDKFAAIGIELPESY